MCQSVLPDLSFKVPKHLLWTKQFSQASPLDQAMLPSLFPKPQACNFQ
jgi:hypothetical protein